MGRTVRFTCWTLLLPVAMVLLGAVALAQDDQVLCPPAQVQLALVRAPEVARVQPAVAEGRGGGLGVAEVAAHHRRAAHVDAPKVCRC